MSTIDRFEPSVRRDSISFSGDRSGKDGTTFDVIIVKGKPQAVQVSEKQRAADATKSISEITSAVTQKVAKALQGFDVSSLPAAKKAN